MKTKLVCALLLLTFGSSALAQEEPDKGPRRRHEPVDLAFEVVPVSHLDLVETAELIAQLEPRVRVRWSESIHALVLRGERARLEEVVALVGRMEKMAPTRMAGRVEVRKLRNLGLDEVLGQLLDVVDCEIAGHEATGQLIIRGMDEEIELADRLLDELDQPRQTVQLTFDFLRVGYAWEDDEPEEVNIPARLDGVWDALRRSGAKSAVLLASAVVRCAEAEEFAARGVQRDDDGDIHYSLEGEVNFMEEADVLRMTVGSEVVRVPRKGSEKGRHVDEFGIETSLAARLGEAVVLASAPAGEAAWAGSIVLVVRADHPEE